MNSAPFLHRGSIARLSGCLLLALALGGCGTEVISYNREFRQTGFTQYNKQDYVDAAQSFKEALRQEPGDYTSRYYLGQCYAILNHPQQAIEEYRTTLVVMSHSLEGKNDLIVRRKVLSALATAIAHETDKSQDLAMIERQQPRTADNALLLARIYRQSGDADTALVRYAEAQDIDPHDPLIAKEYGLYLNELGQAQKAADQLRRAYALNAKDEEVAAALRSLGVIPGPSLLAPDQLAKPGLPLGPLPEVEVSTSDKNAPPRPAPQGPGPVGSTDSPRD